jgi:hypothetical protein
MKLKIATLCAAAALMTAPASAQLLGGVLGGSARGNASAAGGGLLGGIGNSGSGWLGGVLNSRVERSIDTRRGSARANGNASGSFDGGLGGTVDSVLGSGSANGRARANGSANGGIGIDAIGTDAVRGTLGSIGGLGGGASGSASGSASGRFGIGSLALAGSAAANAFGALGVAPGMIVRDTSGRVIGEVQNVRATANGIVDTVFVEVGNRLAALPADNFSVSGDTLVSAMSRAEVRKEARD